MGKTIDYKGGSTVPSPPPVRTHLTFGKHFRVYTHISETRIPRGMNSSSIQRGEFMSVNLKFFLQITLKRL